jgi:hypothetical protein
MCSDNAAAVVFDTPAHISGFINQIVVNQLGAISKLPSMVGIGELCRKREALCIVLKALRLL